MAVAPVRIHPRAEAMARRLASLQGRTLTDILDAAVEDYFVKHAPKDEVDLAAAEEQDVAPKVAVVTALDRGFAPDGPFKLGDVLRLADLPETPRNRGIAAEVLIGRGFRPRRMRYPRGTEPTNWWERG